MSKTRLFLCVLLAACLLPERARAEFNFGVFDGPAATAGQFGVTVKWTEQAEDGKTEAHEVSVEITVDKGDTKDQIRDKLKDRLASRTEIKAAFEVKPESIWGIKCVKGAERKRSTRVTSVRVDDSSVENVRLIGALEQEQLRPS